MTGTAPSKAFIDPPGTGSVPVVPDAAGSPADRFRYDVFVSHSETDADWTLLPCLPGAGSVVYVAGVDIAGTDTVRRVGMIASGGSGAWAFQGPTGSSDADYA